MNTLSSLFNFFNEPETNSDTEQTIPLLGASEYKVAIAIDIGTNGVAIAYAYNNEVHSHTEWEYSKAERHSIKLKTQILLNSSGNKLAFGKDAEIRYATSDNSTSKDWMLFKNIKTHLYDIEQIHTNNIDIENIEYTVDNGKDESKINNNKITELAKELIATNNKKYSSESVFIEVFKHIKQECKSYLTKHKLKNILDSEIEWILLVPAIFSEKVKYKLKKWAQKANLFNEFDQCRIVYESDAASLFIQHELYNKYMEQNKENDITDVNKEINLYKNNLKNIIEDVKDEIESEIKLEKENQYILIDAGGIVDIACHEIVSEFGCEMGVKEILPSITKWGSIYIDKQYKQLLINIFTKDNIEEYIHRNINGWRDGWAKCMDKFRIAKENFFINQKQSYHKVELPKELYSFLENKLNNLEEFISRIKINFKNNKTKNKKMIKLKDNNLWLSNELWKSMYNSVINPIIQQIEQLLESELLYNVQYLCLVGGLCESKYFQKRMNKSFGMESMHRLRIIIPSKPILSVVLGGAYLSITPNYIKERILQFTYGIEIDKSLQSAKKSNVSDEHINEYKYCINNDKYYVKKCFSVYAKKNQKIKNGQIIEKMYNRTPLNIQKIKIKIFYSGESNPSVTACDSVKHLADLILNFDDKNTKRVVVQFHFYDTLIKVFSYPNNQKEKMQQIKLNYALNNLD